MWEITPRVDASASSMAAVAVIRLVDFEITAIKVLSLERGIPRGKARSELFYPRRCISFGIYNPLPLCISPSIYPNLSSSIRA